MQYQSAKSRAEEFLQISQQFRLGELVTESSHPITANLSEVAKEDIAAALDLLFQVDMDVIEKLREWTASGRAYQIAAVVTEALLSGGRVFFTGCGATGRLSILLDSMLRDFWQRVGGECAVSDSGAIAVEYENRSFSVMAGGDFALIKSVEGFEDITQFGRQQIADLGVRAGDVVFAITEGGETSFVIGTAWQALESNAKVYFVYNNPDDILRENVQRSREIIDDPRIEKINLTTGPMAITGSTRMQATSIQLCVMLTILELALRGVLNHECAKENAPLGFPEAFLAALEQMLATLRSEPVLGQLARLVELEESIYRNGGKTNYFADSLSIDVLTDTTERSPTFCTPPFRKFDDDSASESWTYLFVPCDDTETAWRRMLKREPMAVEWSNEQVEQMVGLDDAPRRGEVIRRISRQEIQRFKIGLDGLGYRPLSEADGAIAILTDSDVNLIGFLKSAKSAGAKTALVCLGSQQTVQQVSSSLNECKNQTLTAFVSLPQIDSLLNGVTRVAAKLLLNALSTCIMVRLDRVMGNYMIYVVPSNLKLIDRATRYISRLADMSYEKACYLLFEVVEYVEPRMKSDQAYPPVVRMAITRAKLGISNEEAEAVLHNGTWW